MQNLEIKAKYPDLAQGRRIAEQLRAKFEKTYHQIDTYFTVGRGRLKLREFETGTAQLIFYLRPDESEAKLSEYQLYSVGEAPRLKSMLQSALGISQVVEKWRDVYWYDEVRIHLDRVEGLGNFLEFEGVLSEALARSALDRKVQWLTAQFKIAKTDLIEGSYADLKAAGHIEKDPRLAGTSGKTRSG